MGMLIEGKWSEKWYEPDQQGRFVRGVAQFRDHLSEDGSTEFAAEAPLMGVGGRSMLGRVALFVVTMAPIS